jgi:polyferredoxin
MKEKVLTITIKSAITPLLILTLFTAIALYLWLTTDHIFYLFNFLYIGTSVSLGIFLTSSLAKKYRQWGRRFAQFMVGIYMLGYLGILNGENMQIEGFFFYMISGFFAGATLHYLIAKIAGPLLFNRGWCGWACWTAMVLDLLPWWKPAGPRKKYFSLFRYFHFTVSLALVLILYFLFNFSYGSPFASEQNKLMGLYWVVIGNIFYYTMALTLAILLKDNRAFCKYVCPIPVLQKITSRFSLLKMSVDNNRCTSCKVCEKNCPMNIKILDYAEQNKRILSTECIVCNSCADACPSEAIKMNLGFDISVKEHVSVK